MTNDPYPEEAGNALDLLGAAQARLCTLFARWAHRELEEDPHRATLGKKICNELARLSQLESELLYPALAGHVPDAALDAARQRLEDINTHIAALAPMADAESSQDVGPLADLAETHFTHVNDELYPAARRAVLDLNALGERMRARAAELTAEMTLSGGGS